MCSRQAGKSTVAAAAAYHEAVFYAPALVLIVSPSERQSAEIFNKVKAFHKKYPGFARAIKETALTLEFSNGSRIVALPGKEGTIRCYSDVKLIIIDEAARVMDDLYYTVRPMLAVSKGRLVGLSTPWGKRGWFYEKWISDEIWNRVKITANQCPRITEKFLQEERESMPESFFKQEYMCEFVNILGQLFPEEIIQAAITDDVEPLFL